MADMLRGLMSSTPSFSAFAPYQIFQQMKPAVATRLFSEIEAREPKLYAATIQTLCQQRKLRPVFIEKKTVAERHVWLRDTVGKKLNEGVAAHLLQVWLLGCHKPMLCEFLDVLGIAHDDDGTINELPPAPEKSKLAAAVAALNAKFDADVVTVYLHTFQALDDGGGWSTLGELLAEDASLSLS